MKSWLLLVIVAVACALPAAGSSAAIDPDGAPVYAVTNTGTGDASISERDPRTLGQRGPAVPLGQWEFVAGLSPDGSLLASLAMNAGPSSIRFLDVVRRRWRGGAVALPPLGTGAVRWADDQTVVILGERPDGLRAVVVDAERRRIVRNVRVPGHLEAAAQATAGGLALLLRPLAYRDMGPVLIGVLRPSGRVRIVELGRIQVGYRDRSRTPAIVTDPSTSHAVVFGGLDEPVADVDLRTMEVTYHELRGRSPLSETLGVERFGAWLAPGRIALGGWDDSRTETLRLGVSLVDTRTWRLKQVDRTADFFAKSGDLLLCLRLDGSLGAFGLDGRRRFSISEPVFSLGASASNGRYVYAYNLAPGAKGSALVADAGRAGAVSWPKPPPIAAVLSPGLVVAPAG